MKRLVTDFLGFPCSLTRVYIEIFLIAILGITAFSLPGLFIAHPSPNYERAIFLRAILQATENPNIVSFLLVAVVSFFAGVFARGPVWLIGPVTMLAFPIWTVIDASVRTGSHNLIPFEIFGYAFLGCLYIGPAILGRSIRFLIELGLSRNV